LTSFNIVIDPSRKPNLKITKIKNSSDVSDCFDENVKHSFIFSSKQSETSLLFLIFVIFKFGFLDGSITILNEVNTALPKSKR